MNGSDSTFIVVKADWVTLDPIIAKINTNSNKWTLMKKKKKNK